MNVLEFAEKYEAKYGKPLEITPVGDAKMSMDEAESRFSDKMFHMDPTNNFVSNSNLLSISGSKKRFNLEIGSLDGISKFMVMYKGSKTSLSQVPKLSNSLKMTD